MTGQEYIDTLPEQPNEQHNQMTLEAISSGVLLVEWSPISSTWKDHVATFQVSTDAAFCLLDSGERFRPQFSAKMAQEAAELVGGMMPTTKILDLRHLASNQLNAILLTAGPDMSSTTYSKNYNQKLEAKRANYEGIVSDAGKPWINDNQLANSNGACLYGFFDKSAPFTNSIGLKLWQQVGTKHNNQHQDYSSTLILMSIVCEVDGDSMMVEDIARDPELSNLLNYGGKLNFTKGK